MSRLASLVKLIVCGATAAIAVTTCEVAHAQNTKALSETPTWGVAREASLLNAQIFGAVRSFDRLIASKPAGDINFGFQANWVWGATSVPAQKKGGAWVKQDIDLYANNFAVQVCTSGFFRACGFYSSALTVTFAPDNTPSRVAASLISFTGPLVYGHLAAPLSVAGVSQGKSSLNAIQSSVLGGGAISFGDFFSARAGFVGSIDRRGLYANATAPRIKAFLSAALTNGLSDLTTLMGGFEGLDVRDFTSGVRPLKRAASPIPTLTAYGRQIKLIAPQANPNAIFAGEQLLGQFDFQTLHAGLGGIGKYVDVAAAYAIRPKPVLHEARAAINFLGGTEGIVRLGGGVTQLPDLPFYGVSGGLRPSFLAEVGAIYPNSELKYSLRLNDAETLTYFPFAQNSFSMFFVWTGTWDKRAEEAFKGAPGPATVPAAPPATVSAEPPKGE